MKYILAIGLWLLLSTPVNAQEVGRYEVEVGAAIPLIAKKYGGKFETAWNIYAEGRYNIATYPIDFGLQIQYGAFYRSWSKNGIDRDYHFGQILFVSDYNFRRTKNIALFVGCGAGFSIVKVDHSDLQAKTYEHNFSACVMPRAGIEFFHHLRLSIGYRLMNKEYSNAEISLGIVFGGDRR